jgi:hypothetical protein
MIPTIGGWHARAFTHEDCPQTGLFAWRSYFTLSGEWILDDGRLLAAVFVF